MPVYNGLRHVIEAVESVLAQTYANIELIVVDDGSTDGTPEAVVRGAPTATVVTQPHGGVGAARNSGIAAARSTFIAFLDADDMAPPGRIAAQIAAVQESGADAAFGDVVALRVDANGSREERPAAPGLLPSACLVSATLAAGIGPFDERLRAGEFFDWWGHAGDRGAKHVFVPGVVALRRLHERNTGRDLTRRADYLKVLRARLARQGQS